MTIKQQGGVFGRNPTFNEVEAADITVTNTLGVNTSAPQRVLDVLAGVSNTGVAHFSGSFSDRGLFLSTAVGGTRSDGTVKYNASSGASGSTGQHQFLTDDGLVATIKSVGIALENGKGIDFSATSGTGTSELFDDYEEGTFTPNIGGTTPTYTHQRGRYTKIGRMVNAAIDLSISNRGDGSFNRIYGLPFTVSNNSLAFSAAVSNWTDVDQSFVHLSFIAEANATSLLSYGLTAGGTTTTTAPVVFRTTSSQITLNVVYEAA